MTTDLSNVSKPVAQARGLPNDHYISEEVFEEEREAVLFGNWAGVGFAKDVPNVGDANPVDFLGMPLLILRDQDDTVRVYQNTCRHRGMILVEKKGHIRGSIRCPYHSWCYGLDGALRSTPHVGGPGQNIHEEIKREELGLIEIRSHVFMDVVFVNISGTAPAFEVEHGELLDRWSEFDQTIFHGGADSSFKLDVSTNWKLAVENYCESYHLPWVHPELNIVSKLEDHYNIEEQLKFSGQGSVVYTQMVGKNGERFSDFENLSESWDTGSEYIALYPNVLLGVHRDHAYAILLEPKSTARTVEHVEIYYADEQAKTPALEEMRSKNAGFWKSVFEEDVFVVEGMQKGRHGRLFDGGKFSPVMDSPTHMFHEWVANQVTDHRQRLAAE